jgi:hypothetical protein
MYDSLIVIHVKIARTLLRHFPACAIDIIEVRAILTSLSCMTAYAKKAMTLLRHFPVCAIDMIVVMVLIINVSSMTALYFPRQPPSISGTSVPVPFTSLR